MRTRAGQTNATDRQAGIPEAFAASGAAYDDLHVERLKYSSKRPEWEAANTQDSEQCRGLPLLTRNIPSLTPSIPDVRPTMHSPSRRSRPSNPSPTRTSTKSASIRRLDMAGLSNPVRYFEGNMIKELYKRSAISDVALDVWTNVVNWKHGRARQRIMQTKRMWTTLKKPRVQHPCQPNVSSSTSSAVSKYDRLKLSQGCLGF